MAAELLFVSLGLGYLLMMGRELNDMSQVIAVMFLIAFISILIDKLLLGKIESNIRKKWGMDKSI
jgi:NitT/TauT family transport system permease protein